MITLCVALFLASEYYSSATINSDIILWTCLDSEASFPHLFVYFSHLQIDYRKLKKATRKDHLPLPFIDQLLERLAKHSLLFFLLIWLLGGFSRSPFTLMAKRKEHLPTLMVHLLTSEYPLGYAMYLPLFSTTRCLSSLISLRKR